MTTITGPVKNVAGELADGTLKVQSEKWRESSGSDATITPDPKTFAIVDGVLNATGIDPGRAKMLLQIGSSTTKPLTVDIPDVATITLHELISSVATVDPPVASRVHTDRLLAQQAAADAQEILDLVGEGAVPDAAVAAKVTDTESETRAALDATYAPSKLFTRTYIPTGTSADFAGLQAVIDAWAASGLPGVIRIGAGTLPLSGNGSVGALRIPANKPPLLIEGAGEAATKFTLSRSVPRLFDLYGTGSGNVFDSITVRNFSVDGGGVNNTAIASGTTVTTTTTLVAGQYTAVPVASNASFVGAGTRWAAALGSGAGTAAGSRMLFTLPGSGTTTINLFNSTGSDKTLVAGDPLTGYLYDHVVIGNNNVGSTSGTGQSVSNMLIENIRASNIPTQYVNGLSTFTPSLRFGVYIAPGTGGSVTGLTVRNVHIVGGECGIMSTGSAGSWIDDVVFENCSHDTNLLPTMNSGSLNFMIGQHSYVGRVRVDRCVGKNSADVGLEIDQAMRSTISDCVMDEAFSAGYYVTNFVPPARSLSGPQQTTLTADLTSGATTATVATLASTFPRRGYVKIGSEVAFYQKASSTSLTLIRGMDGSVAAAATSGATVIALEAEGQLGTYTRCRASNLQTPGKGWWYNQNSSIPMQGIRLRDCATRSIVADLDAGYSVITTGCVVDVDIDNHVADVKLVNTTAQPTSVYSAIRFYRPGEAGRNATIGRPTDMKIRKSRVVVDGSVASTSSQMRPLWFGEGWYVLDLDVEVRNLTTGFANGGTSGIFIGGTTTAQVHNGSIALRYVSISTSDASPHILYLNGSVGIMDRINYRLDMSEAYTTTNQIPWNIPSTLRDQLSVELVVPPRLGPTGNATKPAKIYTMTASPYTAKHSDRVILVNMAAAVGTVNLPATNTGNALAVPRPGAGTLVTVKDISGAAATYGITINAAAGETIDGASSKVISTNYGVVHLVSTGTGWAVL